MSNTLKPPPFLIGIAGFGDQTVRSLQSLEQTRESDFGPEYEAARSTISLEIEEFTAWYRIQRQIANHRVDKAPGDDECQKAFERYQMGLSDFY